MHDPFIQLTLLFSDDGRHQSSPLFVLPENIKEIIDGKVYVRDGNWVVREKAVEIRKIVIDKLEENRQAETMGKAG